MLPVQVKEFTRRAFKPARRAMLGDLLGRSSSEFVYAEQAIDTVAEVGKMATLQLCARYVPEVGPHLLALVGWVVTCTGASVICSAPD